MDNKTLLQDGDINKDHESLVFNPFNPKNREITLNDVQCILAKYGINYKINNINLFRRAFIHKSYTKRPFQENEQENITIVDKPYDCLPLSTKSNERLEFIGDGVLECITKYYLYRRFPKADEGFMTKKKIDLVKNEHIGKLAYDMQLHKWFIVSKFAEENYTRTNLKKLGCLFEAFLGALFLDVNKIDIKDEEGWFQNVFVTGPGFQMSQIFVEKIYETHVDWMNLINNDTNYKNILQVVIQKEFKLTPDYLEISHDSDFYEMGVYLCIGQPIYEMKCIDADDISNFNTFDNIHKYIEKNSKIFVLLGKGKHKIKRKAEQIACENCLKMLKLINN